MSVLVQHLIQATVQKKKFEQAIIETVPAQYLYKMDDTAYFMNTETYDQYEIPVVNVEQELLYILKTQK